MAKHRQDTEDARAARGKWRFRGSERPPFAHPVPEGCESVWDYPRPPRICADARHVRVLANNGVVLADSTRAVRVLETASPPTFYVPPEDVRADLLAPSERRTFCEWKGWAREFDLLAPRIEGVAWRYAEPFAECAPIAGFFSFYPAKVQCMVGSEVARPQGGGYYGGWVTSELVGPFKGEPEAESWW